ncbi:hypothetical protein M885DRAFT_562775 [Pelagophyceae sp. CCMP2097]|nr:hypothetical protein M885DRAFT_562775 [Pelagophyceae sp. CCMP2097]
MPRVLFADRSRELEAPTGCADRAAELSASKPVFAAGAGAVAQFVATTGVGAAAVSSGLVSASAVKALAAVVYALFLPCMLFCSVLRVAAVGVTPALLLMPVAAWVQVAFAYALARLVIVPLSGADYNTDAGRELVHCCTFGNPGVLPLLFFTAIFGPPYADAAVLPVLTSYISFYLAGFSPLFWALGTRILAGGTPATHTAVETPPAEAEPANWRAALVANLKRVSPPVAAALLGLFAAVTPLGRLLVGDGAPLGALFLALESFGRAYLPSATLCLAGALVSGAAAEDAPDSGGAALGKQVATIAMARFLVLPACGVATLSGLAALGAFPTIEAAPVLWFFLLTQFSMPTAQNSVIMVQVAGKSANRMAKTIFLLYAAATVPITALLSIYIRDILLGLMFARGEGVALSYDDADYHEALRCYKRAAAGGCADAAVEVDKLQALALNVD